MPKITVRNTREHDIVINGNIGNEVKTFVFPGARANPLIAGAYTPVDTVVDDGALLQKVVAESTVTKAYFELGYLVALST